MAMYTFHLRRLDGEPTGLEALEMANDGAAFARASRILEEHPTCDHVEVWEGERAVVARHRRQPVIRPVDDATLV